VTDFRPRESESEFTPYVPASKNLAEFTLKAAFFGILFGIIFGAANAYLGLRAGLTISTSIPVAVMTVAAFKALASAGQKSSILEANTSQTIGSASSSVASGVIFTLPALFLWGMDPDLLQMTLLAMSGGCLGILFMIPLRRFLIEREHKVLPYPEGTACAEVLKASEEGSNRAKQVFRGIAAGAVFKALTGWARAIPGEAEIHIPFLKKGALGMDLSAALFGVGYILGPRVGSIMVGGGLLSSLIIIPAIAYWGQSREVPLFPEPEQLIRDMEASRIWTRYVRYIGAGAVATAGILTLIRSIPLMVESFKIGAAQLRGGLSGMGTVTLPRTSQDLSLKVVGIGVLVIAGVLTLVPQAFRFIDVPAMRLVAALCVIVFAFFFVTVASRIVGLVGVTSNPTSGMTIAALLGTSMIFLVLGWTDMIGKATALTVGCVVAIAASISGDTSQDLKTGFLLGATPRRQQIGELLGVLTSAAFVCLSVMLLARTFGFGTEELPAPQATLMKLVIEGVLDQQLPWALVAIGAGIAIVCELLKIPSLPFAVGVYLPVSTMVPVFLGGMLRWFLTKDHSGEEKDARTERGILLGSGFVGGEGLLGVALAAATFILGKRPAGLGTDWAGSEVVAMVVGTVAFALLVGWFARTVRQPD
jgi:putative OPT family oligopeptide transporter